MRPESLEEDMLLEEFEDMVSSGNYFKPRHALKHYLDEHIQTLVALERLVRALGSRNRNRLSFLDFLNYLRKDFFKCR